MLFRDEITIVRKAENKGQFYPTSIWIFSEKAFCNNILHTGMVWLTHIIELLVQAVYLAHGFCHIKTYRAVISTGNVV